MKKTIRQLAYFISSILVIVNSLSAQEATCDCTDCPVIIEDLQTVTSVINISGLTNSILNENGQGICGISLEYEHSWISDLEIILIAPDGSTVILLPDGTGGSTNGSTWDITFEPCGDPVTPDPGAGNEYNSSDFSSNTFYSGSYYPGNGCFSDFTGNANGAWILQINDLTFADVGAIAYWDITFCDGNGLSCSQSTTCEAELGDYDLTFSTFCEGDNPIILDPIITGGQTSTDYNTTFVLTTNVGGFPGDIIGYSENADLTGFAGGSYFACGLNYLITDESLLPAANVGNTYSDLESLIADGTVCGDLVEFDCLLVFIDDCSCQAEAGSISISPLQYCETDIIDLDPTINFQNTDPEYGYTFTVSNFTSGSIGTLVGYTDTGDLTGYAAGQYWVCGLSYLLVDEQFFPIPDGTISNLDIQEAIADGTLCAELGAGCFVIDIENGATIPILDFEAVICVGQSSSITVTNYDSNDNYTVQVNSGSFSMLATSTPITTFTPQTDQDIEICFTNISVCGDLQTCANITVNQSSSSDLMILGPTNLCPDNFINYSLSGLGSGTVNGWTINGDASIIGSTTDDNVDVQIDETASTGSAELCVEITNDCGDLDEVCITINVVNNNLTNVTTPEFCDFDVFVEVLIDGTFGVGAWTVVSAPGNVIFDDVNSSNTDVTVDATGDYTLQFVFQCNQTIQVDFTVFDPLLVENVAVVCTGAMYNISFDITGGAAPYLVDGVTVSGNSFTSALIDDDPYSFTITDASGCAPVIVSGNPDCSCDSDAGTISPQNLLISCEGETVTATGNGDDFLDADDTGIWILYSDISDPLGSIILENTTGDFSFVPPLVYSTTYFIAYLVGNDIGGVIDLSDPCLDIAGGTSIIFSEPLGLTGITVDPLNSCGTEYDLTAIQDSPLGGNWIFTSTPPGGSGTFSNVNGISTTVAIDGDGLYIVEYTVDDGLCSLTTGVFINGPEVPIATVISTDCSSDNSTYQVTVFVDGGVAPFLVNGVPFSGSTFTSDFIVSGDSYTFTFSDFNGCTSEEITGSFFCDCDSDAGNMLDDLIEVCGDGSTIALNDGSEFLDGNDALTYVLHTNSDGTLGSVLDENENGTFSFLPGMTYGELYYISAVVGDSDGITIDYSDVCLSVAIGQPIVWYEEVIINSLTSDLDIGCEDFNITIDANTAIPGEWSVVSFPSGGSVTFSTNGNITNVIVDVVGVYNLQYEITNGTCTDTEEITITLSQAPTISNVNYDCDDANENYQVSFEINGGIPPYNVNGTVIAGNIFTSVTIPNGQSNDYVVTDDNGCSSGNITTNNDCSVDCTSFAGSMPQDTIKVCYDSIGMQPIIQISNDGNAILDGDDIGVYILHYSTDNNFAFPIATSITGVFQDIDTLIYDTLLYITYVVGNEMDGIVDLLDPCLSISLGQPIIFYRKPEVLLGEDLSICGLTSTTNYTINTSGGHSKDWAIISTPIGGNITIDDASTLNLEADTYGNYSISLTVTEEICSSIDTLNIEFKPVPIIDVMEDFSTCFSDLTLTSTSNGNDGLWVIPTLPELVFVTIADTTFVSLDTFGIFDIIRIVSTDGCTASDTVTIEIYPPSEFIITGSDCDADNENYIINYEIFGSSYPYTINGQVINEGEIANLTAESDSTINIIVLDSNLCEIYNDSITRSCDCGSELSINPQDLFRACIQDTLFVTPVENFTIEDGDSLVYVFHSSPTDVITNIIAVSGDPFFLFDSQNMNTVIPYFVSVVIYSGGDFTLNSLEEPCTQTDLRRPVAWYGPSQTTIDDQTINVCEGDDIVIPISHIGAVPITVGITNTNGLVFQIDITEEGITDVVIPMNASGVVSISYVVPLFFCDNTFSGEATINVTPPPTIELISNTNVCNNLNEGSTIIQLSDLILSSETDGQWTGSDGMSVSDLIDFDGLATGDYTYIYTVVDTICGDVADSTIITVTDCLEQGCPDDVLLSIPEVCEGGASVNLDDYVSSEYQGIGYWTYFDDIDPVIVNDPSVFLIDVETLGSVNLSYTILGLPIDCDSVFLTSIVINEAFSAGVSINETNEYCTGSTTSLVLFDLIESYDFGGVWSSEDTDLFDASTGIVLLSNLTSGTYQFDYTISTSDVCPSTTSSVIINISPGSEVQLITTDPLCFGGNDGAVDVLDLNGNLIQGSYQIFDINGELVVDENSLTAGTYYFFGEGTDGCEIRSEFILNDPIELFLDLGVDIVLNEGEVSIINANTNINGDNIDFYEWLVNQSALDADSYESLELYPYGETIVELSITDTDGCIVADDISITILSDGKPEVEVVLPNVFNPINSEFGIAAFDEIINVTTFSIYDRWGNRVFLAANYNPAAANQKWDGNYNGSSASTGVYVYYLEYIDNNGEEVQLVGDVTLVR